MSFVGPRARGQALSRLRAGVVLPGAITILDGPVPKISGLRSGKNFFPYDTESVAQSFLFDWPTGNGNTFDILMLRTDGAQLWPPTGNAIKIRFGGTQVSLARWTDGVETTASRTIAYAFTPTAGTPCIITIGVDKSLSASRVSDGTVLISNSASDMNSRFAAQFASAGTFVSMHGDISGTALGSNLSNLRAQGNAVAISVTASSLDNSFRPAVEFNYTGPNHTGYNMQLFQVDGTPLSAKLPATVTQLTPTKLRAVAASTYTSAQFGTKVVARLYEIINNVESGYSVPVTLDMPAALPAFGANLMNVDSSTQFRRIANGYRVTQDGVFHASDNSALTAGELDAQGYPTVSGIKKYIGLGDGEGTKRVLTWEGDGTLATLSVPGLTNLTVESPNVISWNESFSRNVTVDFNNLPRASMVLNPTSVNYPKNIKLYTFGEDRNSSWAPSYLNMHQPANGYNGAARFMDVRFINNNNTELTWAMRTTPDKVYPGLDGMAIEFCIEFCNATGRDMWMPIPANATNDYVEQLTIAITTGANLSQGKPWSNGLSLGLKWYFERSNETWNAGFSVFRQDRARYAARTGETELGDGNGGVEQGYKEHAFQYNRMANCIKATAPNWNGRIVFVMATSLGGGSYDMAISQIGPSNIHAIAVAPYIQCTKAEILALPNKLPASLETIYVPRSVQILQNLSGTFTRAKANGHRCICYEGAADFAFQNVDKSALSPGEILAFRTSISYYKMMYAHLNYWKVNYGDLYMQYGDTEGNPFFVYQWGLQSYQGEDPAYGLQALLDVKAGAASRY
jgi:hypothetical protein